MLRFPGGSLRSEKLETYSTTRIANGENVKVQTPSSHVA